MITINIDLVHYVVTCARTDRDDTDYPVVGVFCALEDAVKFCKTFKKPTWKPLKLNQGIDLAIESWCNGRHVADYDSNGVDQGAHKIY